MNPVLALSQSGQSVWLDHISRRLMNCRRQCQTRLPSLPRDFLRRIVRGPQATGRARPAAVVGQYGNQECLVLRCPVRRSADRAGYDHDHSACDDGCLSRHGRVRVTLEAESEEAEAALTSAAALGLDVHAITEHLQVDAIKAFASSFDELLATVAEKRRHMLTAAS